MQRFGSLRSSWAVVTAVALGVAPLSCKDEADKKEGDSAAASKSSPSADEGGEPAAPGEKPGEPGGVAKLALEAAGLVPGPRNIEPKYPVELDALLDLVPADADNFIIVRDVGALVEGSLGYYEAQKVTLEGIRDEVAKDDPGDGAEMGEGLDKLSQLRKTLADSGIDLSAGLVIAGNADDKGMIVYGAAKADALPAVLAAMGEKGELPDDCKPVASAKGYMVCARAGAPAYAAGEKAADLRKKVADGLPGVDLERANVVAHIQLDDGSALPFAVETGQGMAHAAFAIPALRDEVGRYLEAGKGPGLGIIGPGQPFLWGQGSKAEIAKASSLAPAMARTMIDSLTGEVVMGGLAGTRGYVIAAGVDDPTPAAGLVGLGGLAMSEVPKSLPDGTKIDAKAETVDATQTLHFSFTGGPQEKIVDSFGYVSEIFAFAAGSYGIVSFGATSDVVKTVADYKGTGPSEEMLAALPTPLAKTLESGDAAFAMYMPFDALQSRQAEETMKTVAGLVPPREFGASDPETAMRLGINLLAPLSSTSVWMTHLSDGPVIHVALQGFAEAGTPEGKDALDAMSAVAGGADRTTTYDALAKKYPKSTRASAYEARAGRLGDPFGSLFALSTLSLGAGAWFAFGLLGAMAAPSPPTVAVPAAPPAAPPPPAP